MTGSENVERALSELASREKHYEDACLSDADAEHAYRMRKAQALLAAEGTEKAREAKSIVDSNKEMLAHLKAKAVRDFTKEKLRDSQQALSARQSLLTASSRSDQGYSNDRRVT